MYRGRWQLGDTIPLGVLTKNSSGSPTLPTGTIAAPIMSVMSDASLIKRLYMPIQDKFGVTAYFLYPLLLDGNFSAGHYRVAYQWMIGAVAGGEQDDFEVVAGGHASGSGIAMAFYNRLGSNWVIMQLEDGTILQRRNPRVG